MTRFFLVLALAVATTACSPTNPQQGGLDTAKIEAGIDRQLGGRGTCVVLTDIRSGQIVYQYGSAEPCMSALPPCATFNIVTGLVGLDNGLITDKTVLKWDGTPQPSGLWQADADMAKAFKGSILWWWQRTAVSVGRDRFVLGLKRLDYGDKNPDGPAKSFWLGAENGGALTISTRQQADFLRRLYVGRLAVKPETTALMQGLLVDEIRTDSKGGKATMSGVGGSCATASDGSRSVGWWVGRLQTPVRDLVFAASVEGEDAPPGVEVQRRVKEIFAGAGLWPAG